MHVGHILDVVYRSVDIDENKLPKVASDCHPVAAPLAVFSLAKWILRVLSFMTFVGSGFLKK